MSRLRVKPSRGGLGNPSGGTNPSGGGGGWTGTQSPTGRNPIFIANSDRQDIWLRMKADYDANPTSPATTGGKYYKGVVWAADHFLPSYFYSLGQWPAFLYQVTGDQAWADLAWTQIQGWYLTLPVGTGDANIFRVWTGLFTIMYDWLYPGLTPTQRTTYYNRLVADNQNLFDTYAGGWGTFMVGGDSDQILGHWGNLALLYLLDPTNTQVAAMWNHASTGGFDATASSHNTTGRNAIKQFADLAVGGEWCESSSYNLGTIGMFTPQNFEAIRTATGIDHFPEYTALYPYLSTAYMAHWSPDLLSPFPWGDDEHAYQRQIYGYAEATMTIAGLLQNTVEGQKLQGFITEMIAKYGFNEQDTTTFYPHFYGNAFMLYNPYASSVEWKTTKVFYGAGKGMLLYKSGFAATDSMFCVDSGQRVTDSVQGNWWVQHLVEYVGHFELYGEGEWLLRSPFGYDTLNIRGAGRNCPLMHGINGCHEYRRVTQIAYDDAYASLSLTMGGSMQDKAYENLGATDIAVHEWTRDIVFLPGPTHAVIVFDRANVVAIPDPTVYAVGMTYGAPRQRIIGGTEFGLTVTAPPNRKQIILHMPVSPTISGSQISWTTPGGKAIKLTQLLPTTINTALRDEAALRVAGEYDFSGPVDDALAPLAYHVSIYPTTTQQWDTFLGVIYASGTHGTLTTKTNGTSQGVHGTRPGTSDFLVLFNGAQGASLNTTPHHASHSADLAIVRLRNTGFTHSWTASGTSTIVILNHLDPTKSWTKSIDGTVASALVVDSSGHVKFVVSGAGAHTLVVA